MFEEEEEEKEEEEGIGVERAGDGVVQGSGGGTETFIVIAVVVVEGATEIDLVVDRTGGLDVGLGGATAMSEGRLRAAGCSRSECDFRTSVCLPSSPERAERVEAGDKTSAADKAEDMEGSVHSD